MFVLLSSTMLDYYVEENGLPYISRNLAGGISGFVFAQPGGYDVEGMERVESAEEMHAIASQE